jgi:hypothetical protein
MIPLETQEWLLAQHLSGDARGELHAFIDRHWDTIVALTGEGLRTGYPIYGSRSYGLSTTERTVEVLEELRDSVNYMSTGPVE